MRTKVTIENGVVTLDAEDGQGSSCEEKHAPIRAALEQRFSNAEVQQELKPEYYDEDTNTEGDMLTE